MSESLKICCDSSAKCVKIIGSWKITSREEQTKILENLMETVPFFKERPLISYLREWRAHNRLHRLGLFKERTKDVDLDVGEPMWRRIGYFFLGF